MHLFPSIGVRQVPGYPCELFLLAGPPCIDYLSNTQIPVVHVEKNLSARLVARQHEIHSSLDATLDRIDATDFGSFESV